MSTDVVLAGVMLAALVIYSLLGGADYGAGFWDLMCSGPRRQGQRDLIARAIQPVWEANHIWLILVVVLMFSGFPAAFSEISLGLAVPIFLILLGIVLRGSSYVFRAYFTGSVRTQLYWGKVFSISSSITPLFLGIVIGAISRFWLSNQNSAKHLVIAAEITGDATVEALVSAVAAAQLRHPLLRISIQSGPDGPPCFHEHANIPIPSRIVPEENSVTWTVEMAKELATPILVNGAPLLRITVLRKSGGSTLLLSMHHSIADGLSSAFVIRDILEALSGKPLQPLTLTGPQENLCSATADPPPPSAPVYPPATLLRRNTKVPTVQALKLSKELTMKLRTHAREVGATVHGALVAAFTFAGRQLSSDWLTHPVRVVSPVNNRKLLGLEDQCALSIIFPTGAYAPDSEERLRDVARAVKHELTPVRSVEGLSIIFSGFRQLMSTSPDVAQIAAFELQVCACEGMVSNLGVLPFETSFGGFKLESLWGPSVFVGIEGEQMIGAATLNGAIHLLHTSYTPIPKLLQTMEATLEAMAR